MRQEDSIQEKYGKDSGMKVPEGYFKDLQLKIMDSLPEYEEQRRPVKLNRWQRLKPYVYLAAMFCGIWLMMKVFHQVSQPMLPTLDNPPAALVQLIDDDSEFPLEPAYIGVSDYDVEEDVMLTYDSFEEFEKDFGYDLSPKYASVVIPQLVGA